jgi:opacity protein-like surface antigen
MTGRHRLVPGLRPRKVFEVFFMSGSGTTPTSRSPALWAAALCAALAGLPAAAQTSQTTMASTSDWQYELVPYVWLPGIRSDVKLGPLPGNSLGANSRGILNALDYAAMGTFQVQNGSWGGLADAVYAKLSVSNQWAGGLLGGYNVDSTPQMYTLAGYYRVLNGPVEFDLLGGARYVSVKTSVDIAPSIFGLGRQFGDTASAWNGIVGARAILPLTDKWSLTGYVDVGDGGGARSWQAIAGASYQFSPSTSVKFGYRYISFRPDDPVLKQVDLGGVYAGLGFKF